MVYWVHSAVRYLVLVGAIVTLVYALFGWATSRPFEERMRKLGGAFAGLMHLQLLIGLAVLFTGRFSPAVTGHIFMMLFAAGAAQVVPSVMRRRPPEARTYPPYVVGTLIAVGLMMLGVSAIGRSLI